MDKISVFIVDDHELFREGLKLLLTGMPFIGEVREASNGMEFLAMLGGPEEQLPDVVFMDIEMPGMNGIDTTIAALEQVPSLRIVALSMYGEEEFYTRMIEVGVKGFILKNSGIQEVESAIHSVAEGRSYFSQEIVSGLVENLTRRKKPSKPGDLSEREAEVLSFICKGFSNKQIADTLFVSKRTVDKHRENLLLKTGAKNTAGLVLYAIQSGLIEL
ncbi:MAG: response regulator transcription factor [Bacteroidales bacterium]|nr:response regulator transcription factor [Bacteroidales bacterium]